MTSRDNDPYDLQRFIQAQASCFEQVCAELRDGRKVGHWMWFIFPQIQGLGYSQTSRHFALSSRSGAAAYLEHATLGPRLREFTRLVNRLEGLGIREIFGHPDDLKFRSSMTLFAHATTDNEVFMDAIQKYFGGEFDRLTLDRLNGAG